MKKRVAARTQNCGEIMEYFNSLDEIEERFWNILLPYTDSSAPGEDVCQCSSAKAHHKDGSWIYLETAVDTKLIPEITNKLEDLALRAQHSGFRLENHLNEMKDFEKIQERERVLWTAKIRELQNGKKYQH